MTPQAPARLLAAILTLVLAAIAVVAWDTCVVQHAERSREFQELIGGLGMGPNLTMSQCEFSFDPRVSPDWRTTHHPIACGEYFCPWHACSVFYLAPLKREVDVLSEAPADASIR